MAPRKPRRRDYRAETARREELNRERGYATAYAKRVEGTERGSRERARARGHGSDDYARLLKEIRRFLRELGTGDMIVMPEGIASVERDGRGRYRRIHKLVFDAEDMLAPPRDYVFAKITRPRLVRLIDAEDARGATWAPAPSQDQRRLVSDVEAEGGY